jgi:hypothetical protein
MCNVHTTHATPIPVRFRASYPPGPLDPTSHAAVSRRARGGVGPACSHSLRFPPLQRWVRIQHRPGGCRQAP